MAIWLKNERKDERSAHEYWLLDDLLKIEAVVVGNCFDALNFLQRKTTMIAIHLAAKVVSGVRPSIELEADGWRLGPDCSDVPSVDTPALARTSLNDLIQKSYTRDYNSEKARVALRSRAPEAADKYFEPDDDDSGEFSPALVRFRERSQFQLTGV